MNYLFLRLLEVPWYQQCRRLEARTWLFHQQRGPRSVTSSIWEFKVFLPVSEPGYFKVLPALPLYGSSFDQENTMLERENLGLYIRFINSLDQNGSSSCRYTVGLYSPYPDGRQAVWLAGGPWDVEVDTTCFSHQAEALKTVDYSPCSFCLSIQGDATFFSPYVRTM